MVRRNPHRRVRGLVALAMLAMGSLMLPAAASAAAPHIERLDPYDLEFLGSVACGTFDDNYVDRYHVNEVDYFDGDDNLVRVIYYIDHTSDDMNSVTLFTLHEHGFFREVDDYVAGTITVTGNQEIANRVGAGAVIADTGRLILDGNYEPIFFAGGRKHSQVLLGEEIWCDALS